MEELFSRLAAFTKRLMEAQRSVSGKLSEEEVAHFDLLGTLKHEKLVLDW